MTDISLFKVSVSTLDGKVLIMNLFPAKSDADALFEAIATGTKGYDRLVESTPYDSLIISYDEMVNGIWSNKTTQMLIKGEQK